MEKIVILTDTSSGIKKEECEKICKNIKIEILPLPFVFDGVEYNDFSIDNTTFYDTLKKCKKVSTSQPSIENILNKLDELLINYEHILYFPISSGLSGTYNTVMGIVSDDKYKNRVTVVDHKTLSTPMKAMIINAIDLINAGVELNDIKERIENNERTNIWIAVNTLEFLKKGGRINRVSAMIGNILNIKPILYCEGGTLSVVKKERSFKKCYETISHFLEEIIKAKNISKYTICIAFSEVYEEAIEYKNYILDKFSGIIKNDILLDELPLVTICHIGPGAVGLGIYKNI